jgi:diaminopimelate epimerase
VKFTKMQGLGNDYLYVFSEEEPQNPAQDSIRLSNRHFGAGSDGMIWILPSKVADFKMRIFNADGSEAMMCGNGIRCVGKYVYDRKHTDKTELDIETLSGIKHLRLHVEDGAVKSVEVDMGKAVVSAPLLLDLSLELSGDDCLNLHASRNGSDIMLTCVPVDMGNPHAVIFCDDADNVPVEAVGSIIEHMTDAFPDGVNVEFVSLKSETEMRMRVWERGSGVTMACGTGSCASVAAAVTHEYCQADVPVSVVLDGGTLTVTVAQDNEVLMAGPAAFVFEGEEI